MEHYYPAPSRAHRPDPSPRNNHYHSSSPYYGVQKRDKGGGRRHLEYPRSGSSESSWTLWHEQGTLAKSDRLCNALLAFTVSIIIVMIIAIAGLAVYMGALRIDTGQLNLMFDGSIRITYGDTYNEQLANQSSPLFREKARKFKTMLETVYGRSNLGPALKQLSIIGFKNGSLIVFFRIVLDRRKLPKSVSTIEDNLKKILMDELTNLRPVAMKNLRVDLKQLHIKRYIEPSKLFDEEEEAPINHNLKSGPDLKNGVHRKPPPDFPNEKPPATEKSKPLGGPKKAPPSKTITGSFTVLKTEEGAGDKVKMSVLPPDDKRRPTSSEQPHSTGRTTKLPVKGKVESMPSSQTSTMRTTTTTTTHPTTPATHTIAGGYNIQHSQALNDLLRLSKNDVHTTTTTTRVQGLGMIDNAPWRPILTQNESRYYTWTAPVLETDELSSQGVGEAEVIAVPSLPEEPQDSATRNGIHFTKQSSLALNVLARDDAAPPLEFPEEPASVPEKIRAPPGKNKGAVFGADLGSKEGWPDLPIEGRNSPHASGGFQGLDLFSRSYVTESPPHSAQPTRGERDPPREESPSPSPVVTLLPVRSNSGVGRPLKPRPWQLKQRVPEVRADLEDKLKHNTSSTEILSRTKTYSSQFIQALVNNTDRKSVSPPPSTTTTTTSTTTEAPRAEERMDEESTPEPETTTSPNLVILNTEVVTSTSIRISFGGNSYNLVQDPQGETTENPDTDRTQTETSVATSRAETMEEMETTPATETYAPEMRGHKRRTRALVISSDYQNDDKEYVSTTEMDDSRSQFEKPLFTPSVSFNRELKRKLGGNRTKVQEPGRHNVTSLKVKPLNHGDHKRPSSETLLQIISQLASTSSDRNQTSKLSNKSVAPSFTINRGGLPLLIKVLNKIPPSLLSSKSHTIVSVKESSFSNYTGCKSDSEYRCKNGECVAHSLRCNQLVDCSDGSDEKNCTCADYLRGQLLSRKICDGVVDCWDFSDETNCDWCLSGQHVCANSRLCVNQSQICDGRKDCPFGDDEKQCINVAPSLKQANDFIYHATGHLMVRKQGVWGKLCLQNPAASHSKLHYKIKTLGQAACKSLSFRELDFIEPDQDLGGETQNASSVYYDLISSNWTTISNTSFQRTTCPHRQVIKIRCKDLQCGVRPQASGHTGNSIRYSGPSKRHSRIVGGGNAGLGSWPWQAALYKEGEFQCGAALINAKWLLSAGHCFYNAQEDYWVARLGALRRGVNFASPYEQVRTISRIILHPEYQAISFMNDISLLELNEPVQTSHYIRPICLPPPSSTLEDGTMCTVIGWGQLFEIDRVFPDTLQEVQLPVISAAECRKRTLFLPLYRVTDNMFCAGYERGGRDACLGDSGGPLMCQETDGRWSLYGVTSNGYGCARANRPGVYTKVVNYIGWIQSSIAVSNNELPAPETRQCAGHRCRLGECLPQQRVCNGYIECSDGSDEKDCWQD